MFHLCASPFCHVCHCSVVNSLRSLASRHAEHSTSWFSFAFTQDDSKFTQQVATDTAFFNLQVSSTFANFWDWAHGVKGIIVV